MRVCSAEVHLAFPQGPCFGVKRSINIAHRLLSQGKPVYALHPLVHNEMVMSQLLALGLILEQNPEKIPDGATVLLSAHGTPRDITERLRSKSCRVVDAVCPLVLYVHKAAFEAVRRFGRVNVVGDPEHAEIKSLLSGLPAGSFVLAGAKGDNADPSFPVVFQSTTDPAVVQQLTDVGFKVVDTVCFATKGRQAALELLLQRCEAVIVLGSHTSANSRHLLEKVTGSGKPGVLTLSVEEARQFALKYEVVGIIAGASTPLALVSSTYETIMRTYEEICDNRTAKCWKIVSV